MEGADRARSSSGRMLGEKGLVGGIRSGEWWTVEEENCGREWRCILHVGNGGRRRA